MKREGEGRYQLITISFHLCLSFLKSLRNYFKIMLPYNDVHETRHKTRHETCNYETRHKTRHETCNCLSSLLIHIVFFKFLLSEFRV